MDTAHAWTSYSAARRRLGGGPAAAPQQRRFAVGYDTHLPIAGGDAFAHKILLGFISEPRPPMHGRDSAPRLVTRTGSARTGVMRNCIKFDAIPTCWRDSCVKCRPASGVCRSLTFILLSSIEVRWPISGFLISLTLKMLESTHKSSMQHVYSRS